MNSGNPYHDARGRFSSALNAQGHDATKHALTYHPMTEAEIAAHARHALDQYRAERARGMPPADAAGWAASSEAESQGDPSRPQLLRGPGRGLFQWGGAHKYGDRREIFLQQMHIPIEQSTIDQQRDFRDWELNHTQKTARDHILAATTVAGKARAITTYYLRPKFAAQRGDDRARIAERIFQLMQGK